MHSLIRKTPLATVLAAACLLGTGVSTLPVAAQAQTTSQAPQVYGLQVSADDGVQPGSALQFRVEGTPRGRAAVRLNDRLVIALRETTPGVYRGSYTVKRNDAIDANGLLRASLTRGNRVTTQNYTFPPSMIAQAAPPAVATGTPHIESFAVRHAGALEPGAQLNFVLRGAPGGTAAITIPGVARDLALTERRPGVYRGSYTVRRQDNPAAFASTAATLRVGNQLLNTALTEPMAAGGPSANVMGAAGPLPFAVYSHGNNTVIDTGPQQLRGRTTPYATVRVRIDAVPPLVGQRLGVAQQLMNDTVQADAQGNFAVNFDPRALPLPGTRYEVNFSVASGTQNAESKLVLVQRG